MNAHSAPAKALDLPALCAAQVQVAGLLKHGQGQQAVGVGQVQHRPRGLLKPPRVVQHKVAGQRLRTGPTVFAKFGEGRRVPTPGDSSLRRHARSGGVICTDAQGQERAGPSHVAVVIEDFPSSQKSRLLVDPQSRCHLVVLAQSDDHRRGAAGDRVVS